MADRQQVSSFETRVLMPAGEEATPVRTIDLKHLKRDIQQIPDGQGKFDNAFWGFSGVGAPLIVDYVISLFQGDDQPVVAKLLAGMLCIVVAGLFKWFGKDAKDERQQNIDCIIENIDDFSKGVTEETIPDGTARNVSQPELRQNLSPMNPPTNSPFARPRIDQYAARLGTSREALHKAAQDEHVSVAEYMRRHPLPDKK
jgi:hypothetical protein